MKTTKLMLVLFATCATALAAAIAIVEDSSPDQLEHRAFTTLLQQRRALDQDVVRHALEARFHFGGNYDQLAKDDSDARRFKEQSELAVPAFLRPRERAQVEQALSRYAATENARQRLLEQFKSKNALLKNSVSYFPGLAGSVLRQTHDANLVGRIEELRAQTLELALRDDPVLSKAQRTQVALLSSMALGDIGLAERRTLDSMLSHARAIVDDKLETDQQLSQILALPVDQVQRQLDELYQRSYARAAGQAHVFGQFVSGLSLMLLSLVAYAGLRLRRAAKALGRYNEQLEASVAERTAELRDAMLKRELVEIELRQSQKLEAVGQLASGLAHEINTPIQYVGDSLHFLREAFADLLRLLTGYRVAHEQRGTAGSEQANLALANLEEEVDSADLEAEIPKAFEQTLDGTRQVGSIVKAMKSFAHTSPEKESVDLNAALENTLIVARNEYKYMAELVTEFGDIPAVTCNASGVRQVFLNLIVNAAHAIGDVGDSGKRGKITIRTEGAAENVVVSISDTGSGIPTAIRDRVFDPFFTTKPPGKGSGQGLAISQSIIAQHGGKLWFETELGRGTTFFVELPVVAAERRSVLIPSEPGRAGVWSET